MLSVLQSESSVCQQHPARRTIQQSHFGPLPAPHRRLPLVVGAGSDQASASRAVADRAEDCGLALWFVAGTDFQVQLMTAKGAPKDELLQAVMQRLEETVEADWMEAEQQPLQELAT